MNYGCIIFDFRDSYTLFEHNIIIEFDKNANSFYDNIMITPNSHKVSLATIGVCVFCASASVDALLISTRRKK